MAHNYAFDLNFLQQEFRRADLSWPNPLAEIATLDLSMRCFPHTKGTSSTWSASDSTSFSIKRTARQRYRCGECFVAMTKRHEVANSLDELLEWANASAARPQVKGYRSRATGSSSSTRVLTRESIAASSPSALDDQAWAAEPMAGSGRSRTVYDAGPSVGWMSEAQAPEPSIQGRTPANMGYGLCHCP